jgi:clumping factor A
MRPGMSKQTFVLACTCAALWSAFAAPAHADPMLRKQVDQRGDFVLLGNTLAFECAPNGSPAVPAPVVGTIGQCPDANQTAPDVYFRADEPAAGQCAANESIQPANARSTAMLNLPAGAKITYARLYWGALFDGAGPDTNVLIERPATGLRSMVTADGSVRMNQDLSGTVFWYQSTADVTQLVQQQGPGAFRIGDVGSINIVNLGSLYPFVGWYMVVFYETDTDPVRNLALFDGMDLIEAGAPKSVQLRGFLVPSSGFDGKLGVVAVEGDPLFPGDALTFDSNTLSDAQNPADNFFNATRSNLGVAVSNQGDLPQLTGTPRSMSGIDMDVVNVTPFVKAGQSTATLSATTVLDTYILTAFVTSISTLKPDFKSSTKIVKDLNGGRLLPGEEVEYSLTFHNTGSDASSNTIVRDALPAGVTFVPGSLQIVSGPNMGAKTDAADGDQAEYDSAMRRVVARLGMGASGTLGGSVASDGTSVVSFRVKVDDPTRGKLANQAVVTAAGMRGSPSEDAQTDGDTTVEGPQTTDTTVDECATNADCKPPKAMCDISQSPQICVGCVTSDDCKDPNAPDCNTMTHVCECVRGTSQCQDTDGDGISDGGEETLGTDPKDADTDDDGTRDGAELAPDQDSDGDGLINALDADSDNDGLFDGTEQGFDCEGPGVDKSKKRCKPDADRGATKTNPTQADTDRGGVTDGSEDSNLNGAVDSGETDPTLGHEADDAKQDRDNDGLSDKVEMTLRSDPNDADSDDDGVPDGAEANPAEDTDLDGPINLLDVDSDNDALYDGTEVGRHCADPATNVSKMHCKPDADLGMTKTSMLIADTDKGGVIDGSEDIDGNGVVDTGELDPTKGHGDDDKNAIDTDRDGLSDGVEKRVGTDPNDADTDDDGVKDGSEPNPVDDNDGDGKIDALDPDSDDDGLYDGTELGLGCGDPATQLSRNLCTADADSGRTKTSPLEKDTDFGGKTDGFEDFDKNGRVDTGELDPNDPADDNRGDVCETDADCGEPNSGRICVDHKCQPGCRGMDGNSCPDGTMCTSTTSMAGMCTMNPPEPDAGLFVPGKLGGGGCDCGVVSAGSGASRAGWGAIVIGLVFWLRGRRKRR